MSRVSSLSSFSGCFLFLFFHQLEVYLFLQHIHSLNLDFHTVAQLVAFARAASNDLIVVLVKHIVVALERAYGDHTFALVALDFGVDTPFADTRDIGIEHLSQFVGQEFSLLVFHAGTFGISGTFLHDGTMLAVLFILVGIDAFSATEVEFQ